MITLNTAYYGEYRSSNNFNEFGKTVTFSADIYTNYECSIRIYTYKNGYSQSITYVPANTPGTYTVTRSIPDDIVHILYRVEPRSYTNNDAFCYTDNWRLTIL